MKFGGVGLQDAAAMRHAASVIKAEPGQKVVVASALRGVTDAIQNNLEAITHDEARAHILISELRKVHERAMEGLTSEESRDNCKYAIDKVLDHLERLLFGVTYTEELTPRSQDLALSFGERLSARILAGYLLDVDVPAEALDADKLGLATHGPFGWASPDLPTTERNFKERLVPRLGGLVPVITGFFGADKKGHTTILGRGGSDFSAAIVANAIDAEVLEVWKETTGFMTADPRAVPKARRVDEMSYEEAAELANFGAKILHPRTVEPVSAKRIPIRIRELKDPKARGTLIRDYESAPACFIRSVATRKGLNVLKLVGPGMGYTPGVAADVFDVLKREQINVINMAASEATFALLLDATDGKRAAKALQSTKGGVIQDIVLEEQMALVAVVGKGLGDRVGSAAQILQSVSDGGVNIHMISLGASSIAINFVVQEKDAEPALRAVHKTFIEKEQP
ncbi:MAG TPA: aspartate kinase [Candidatus Thermoplasmatota archaeon]|nr:aspartate kinase [Candidatus Thermoplasmatota archaeon]